MDTSTHVVIDTEDGDRFVRPVSLALVDGVWQIVGYSEQDNDLRGFPLVGAEVSVMVDRDIAELERIVADREVAVPTSLTPEVEE